MMGNHPRPTPFPPAGEGALQQIATQALGADNPLSRVRERAGVRVQNARALRADGTDAEQLLWRHLRARQVLNHKFRRQHPIGSYIADFACVEQKLIVELDGSQHAQGLAPAYDAQRTAFFNNQGWRMIRFWNHQVLTELTAVMQVIAQALNHPHPHPLPPAGEGVSQQGY